jgi:hypothetical protein
LLELEGETGDLTTTFFIEAKPDWVMLVPEGLAARRNSLLMGSGFDRLLSNKIDTMDRALEDREIPINAVILIRGDESLEVFTKVRRLLRSKDVTMGYQYLGEHIDTSRVRMQNAVEEAGGKYKEMQDRISIQPGELSPERYPDIHLQTDDGSFVPLTEQFNPEFSRL